MDHATQLKSARSALVAARHAVDPTKNGLLDRDDLLRQMQSLISSMEFLLKTHDQQQEKMTERLTRRIHANVPQSPTAGTEFVQ